MKNKFIKRTDLLISIPDLNREDEKGNVFFNTKDKYLSLTLDNIRITFNSMYKGIELDNPDFLIRKNEGIIVRIKNKKDYPYWDIENSCKKEIDFVEIINLIKTNFNAVETTILQKEFPKTLESLGLVN